MQFVSGVSRASNGILESIKTEPLFCGRRGSKSTKQRMRATANRNIYVNIEFIVINMKNVQVKHLNDDCFDD